MHPWGTLLSELQLLLETRITVMVRIHKLAFLGRLIQGFIPITIRAERAQVLHQSIPVNYFFEKDRKIKTRTKVNGVMPYQARKRKL